jgi:hypothetical protein
LVKPRDSQRLSAFGNALGTAASSAVITGAAAVVGGLVAREFGRGDETDGFFAAYGVYIVLVLVATALRVVVLPPLVRGRMEGRLAGELDAYGLALALFCVPAIVLTSFAPEWPAGLLTASPEAQATCADALVWLVPAAVAQIYAGLAASALAAADEYLVAATGFAGGALAGLVVIVFRLDTGINALAEGIAVNGAVSLLVPLVALSRRGALRPLRGGGGVEARRRLGELVRGVGLPIAVQGLFLIGLRSAGSLGSGEQTSFSYAYLIASSLVAVTASSFSLVSSAPLTRIGLTAVSTARHVRATVWLSVVPIAILAGVFSVAGEPLLKVTLGDAFEGEPGVEAGRLVLYLAPWMLVSAGVAVVFPLLFIAGRTRVLPAIAVGSLVVHAPIDRAGRELGQLPGISLALAVTTALVLAAMLASLSRATLAATCRALVGPAAGCALAALPYSLAAIALPRIPAAGAGTAGYLALLALIRPTGLRDAWAYVRALR